MGAPESSGALFFAPPPGVLLLERGNETPRAVSFWLGKQARRRTLLHDLTRFEENRLVGNIRREA